MQHKEGRTDAGREVRSEDVGKGEEGLGRTALMVMVAMAPDRHSEEVIWEARVSTGQR